jgi:hypothetical protein
MRYTIDVQRELEIDPTYRGGNEETGPDFRRFRNLGNDYLIDRMKQRTNEVFSGLDASFADQDGCAVESMGRISDRENEHLGITDTQIAAYRSFLLEAALAVQEGADPPGVAFTPEANDFGDVYMVSAVVPTDRDWKTAIPEVTTQVLAGAR